MHSSQTYRKNSKLINESLNTNINNNYNNKNSYNKLMEKGKSKTPISLNSASVANFNNNNIIISNNYEAAENKNDQKTITNLNMIFKFKTILNEEVNSKREKIFKIDAKNLRKNSALKNKENEKNNFNTYNQHNNNNNHKEQSKKKYINNDIDPLKSGNINLTSRSTIIKKGNSSTKSKTKSNNNNSQDFKSFKNNDNFKYSINQLKDYLNSGPINNNNSKDKFNKSKNKSFNKGNKNNFNIYNNNNMTMKK